MPRPKLHKHQYAHTAAGNQAPFEFDSKHGGGLITLTETDDMLFIDLSRLDPTVKVRVAEKHLDSRHPRFTEEELRVLAYLIENAVTDGALNDAWHEHAQAAQSKLVPFREMGI